MNQSEFKANTRNRRQAREKACERGTIGFGFTSYWLRKWREFYQPITEHSNAKPKQKHNYFRHSIENRSISTELITKGKDFISHRRDSSTLFSFHKNRF